MKKSRVFLAAAALALFSTPVLAGYPMPKGTFAIGAERLTGIAHAGVKNDPFPGQPGPGDDHGVTMFALLGNGVSPEVGFNGDSRGMFMMPRIGFDYFIIDGLSLGGSLTLMTVSDNDANSPEDQSSTHFLFAPRIGYAYMFGDVVGIWPRGGLAYTHGSRDPDVRAGWSSHYFAFDIDVPLIIAPVKNFAFTVGPIFDVTFGGSQTDKSPREITRDASLVLFGLSAGVVGIL